MSQNRHVIEDRGRMRLTLKTAERPAFLDPEEQGRLGGVGVIL